MSAKDKKYDIKLEWFGHSCFSLDVDGNLLYLDPVRKNKLLCTTLEPQKERKPWAIFVSHEHWDHYDARTILALHSPQTRIFCPASVVDSLVHMLTFEASNLKELVSLEERISPQMSGDKIEINNLYIKCLKASEGLSFLIIFGERKILFMGDSVATSEMIAEKPDVVLFPVWAVIGEEAKPKDLLKLGKESRCIPIHYHRNPDALMNFYLHPKEFKELLKMDVDIEVLERNRTYQI